MSLHSRARLDYSFRARMLSYYAQGFGFKPQNHKILKTNELKNEME